MDTYKIEVYGKDGKVFHTRYVEEKTDEDVLEEVSRMRESGLLVKDYSVSVDAFTLVPWHQIKEIKIHTLPEGCDELQEREEFYAGVFHGE